MSSELVKKQRQLQKEIATIDKQARKLRSDRQELKDEIKKIALELEGIKVSDHAVVRYMERVQGLNLDPIREKIVDAIQPMVDVLGSNGNFPVGDDRQAVLKDKVIVTIK